jgi:chromosome segregation protein
MQLKRLEMAGFKSFAKKTSLEFNTPVTAIVGPNGSGKSNTVEAVRFVLGEQSIKSMRGKSGSDLIFKGSKFVSPMNRAGVSIVFDNRDRIFSFSSANSIPLEFDEVTISREVFSDGRNVYKINGSEVRLKDVHELLASVNIGSSGHHIISQGEADRVLNASSKERKGMIEDALGLKIYQFKIKESERKLEKTEENMKEVQSLRREIAPHIQFLKKQVEKIERAKTLREELSGFYKTYLGNEYAYIKKEEHLLRTQKERSESFLKETEDKLAEWEKNREKKPESDLQEEIRNREDSLNSLRSTQDDLRRSIGRLEGMIEAEERMIARENEAQEKSIKNFSETTIKYSEVRNIFEDLESSIDIALNESSLERITPILFLMKKNIRSFVSSAENRSMHDRNEETPVQNLRDDSALRELKNQYEAFVQELRKFDHQEFTLRLEIRDFERSIELEAAAWRDREREFYELKGKASEFRNELSLLQVKEENLSRVRTDFEMELKEGSALLGPAMVRFEDSENIATRGEQEELRRKIERIKIKLEDIGGGGSDIIKEYEDVVARDQFLIKEMDDISKSIESLRTLIRELKDTLDVEFKTGIEKINAQFQEFFSLMFGGGSAFLSVIVEHKKIRRSKDPSSELGAGSDDDFEESLSADLEAGKLGFEDGIEINVTLPHKKVKELAMLSGGERSLTSIALLFAISQVNPPPFLVLDETDAALDEANSKKYGSMLETLSKYSQLIVVTHNRETMSRAQVLYGVTVGSDGVSKLLSIKFDEAVQIAK